MGPANKAPTKALEVPFGEKKWHVCNPRVANADPHADNVWLQKVLTVSNVDDEGDTASDQEEEEEEEEEEEQEEDVTGIKMISPRDRLADDLNFREWSDQKLLDKLRMYRELVRPSFAGYNDKVGESRPSKLDLGEVSPLTETPFAELDPMDRALVLQRLCDATLEA